MIKSYSIDFAGKWLHPDILGNKPSWRRFAYTHNVEPIMINGLLRDANGQPCAFDCNVLSGGKWKKLPLTAPDIVFPTPDDDEYFSGVVQRGEICADEPEYDLSKLGKSRCETIDEFVDDILEGMIPSTRLLVFGGSILEATAGPYSQTIVLKNRDASEEDRIFNPNTLLFQNAFEQFRIFYPE